MNGKASRTLGGSGALFVDPRFPYGRARGTRAVTGSRAHSRVGNIAPATFTSGART